MTDTRTGLLGVIGDPIGHSLSPLMHSFFLEKFNLNYNYHAFHVHPPELADTVAAFRQLNISGINATIPHKEALLKLVDHVSESAATIGAVNTLHLTDGEWWGHNTDGIGFLRSLGDFREQLPGARVVVLGAGGSAKAIVGALAISNVAEIILLNRTLSRAEELADYFKNKNIFLNFKTATLTATGLEHYLPSTALVVNTTSLGMAPNVAGSPLPADIDFPSAALAYDLIYNPGQTRFLQQAVATGAKIQNGLDMLIFQGIASLEIWTGRQLKIEPYLDELRSLLQVELK
ncbi:shikimate dehydrogenase [bacterium]|nr:shikimate dehydrogenase [bacterium]